MRLASTPSGASDRYAVVMKPPKDWPTVVHLASPHSSRRSASASKTIWSWRNSLSRSALSRSEGSSARDWASRRVDCPVPRWSSSTTR